MRIRGAWLVVALAAPFGTVTHAQACAWPAKFDADTTNAAFPDDNANYWLARFTVAPLTRLKIEGIYPDVRYFSFHVYDPTQAPVNSLADVQIDPDQAGANPFRAAGAARGTYRAYVEFGDPPAVPAANTIYTGRGDGVPNATETLIYRTYVPDDARDPLGGQPLPRLTLQTAFGLVGVPFQACEPLPPSANDVVSDTIASANMPNEIPRGLPYPPGQDPPRFIKFWGTVHEFARRVPGATAYAPKNGGFLSNQHINYLYALFSRHEGDLVVLHGKAPTAPDTRHGEDVTTPRDLRYFSICQNELATQRFVECLRDDEISLDDEGFFTIVVSDPEDRPSNAANWIPWGGAYYDGNLIYRHMLPSPSFEHAIQRVAYGLDEQTVMGDYFPLIRYCSKARFESGAWSACTA